MPVHTDETVKINTNIGEKIETLRLSLGLDRKQLAEKISCTHQQLRKYEVGENRVSAARLALVAAALEQPVSYFFDESLYSIPRNQRMLCLEVARNFSKIKNPASKTQINNLIRTLSGE